MDPHSTDLPFGTARRWTKVAGTFFAVHLMQQVAAMATGLLFTRTLSVDEFAIYTIATSALLTFSFATDLGSSSALLHFFHQSQLGKEPYANMVNAVLSLRRWMFLAGTPVAVGALTIWGRSEGLTPPMIALTCVLVLATVWVQVQGTTRIVILRLEGAFAHSYRAEVTAALARLAAAGLLIAIGFRDATSALATALVSAIVLTWMAHGGRVPPAVAPVAALQRKVVRYLAPALPSAVYFAVQGQFLVWCAAWFGNDLSLVANIGALGRLGLIVGAFGGLSQVMFLPRLVKIADERLFVRRMVQFGSVLVAVAGGLFLASIAAPSAFLWLIGPSYASLSHELPLIVLASGLGLLGAYFGAVASARSWNRLQPAALMLLIVVQALLIAWLPLDTTFGVAWFGLAAAVVGVVTQGLIVTLGLVRPSWVAW
jgi:O-antigen/teichoic acid export membrane protein